MISYGPGENIVSLWLINSYGRYGFKYFVLGERWEL